MDRTFCLAPMLDWTDRHQRFLARLMTQRALLYTEMLNPAAVVLGDRRELLDFNPCEHPVALQLGGSDPDLMARAASMAEEWGYDEVNMNVGCPSERGLSNRFGACLMADPEVVAACVRAMVGAVSIPVTVKCRLGIAGQDSYEWLVGFVGRLVEAGCQTFVIHARHARLDGLSPRQNRSLPPLRYGDVHHLKRDHPDLEIVLNGGLRTLEEARTHLEAVDGVMLGREAYINPYLLARVDQEIFSEERSVPSRREVLEAFFSYAEQQVRRGVGLPVLVRPLLGFYLGRPRARVWRRFLNEAVWRSGAGTEALWEALEIAEGTVRAENGV
jgi:tRNA-dihydrouridine synthase A